MSEIAVREKYVAIDDDVRVILEQATFVGVILKLPQMSDRGLYQRVDKVLKALAGKWSKAHGGHIFQTEPEPLIRAALENNKARDDKKTFEFFETPTGLADDLVHLANIKPGMRVLEPSAGAGALVKALRRKFGRNLTVHCCEIQAALRRQLLDAGEAVMSSDFLAYRAAEPYQRVVMNPPFSNHQDIAHVRRAFGILEVGGVLVAVMSESAFQSDHKVAVGFRDWLKQHGQVVRTLDAGTFRDAGTMVHTRVVKLTRCFP